MEIQESSLPVFYLSRALGLAPFILRRGNKGHIQSIKLSYWMCCYSVLFLLTTATVTFRFIITDADSRNPVRMRTATSKFVTIFDVSIVIGVCTCAVISGIIGFSNVREFNRKLCEADKELVLFNDQIRDRKRGIIMTLIVFITMTVMIILDFYSKYRSTLKIKAARELKLEHAVSDEIYIVSYTPFYILYYIMMGVQTQFAQTAFSLARRYRRLNMAIESAFSLRKVMQTVKDRKVNLGKVETALPGINAAKLVTVSRAIHDEHKAVGVSTFGATVAPAPAAVAAANSAIKPPSVVSTITRTSYFLDRLSSTHAILGESVCIVSSSYGLTLLVLLASCLLHLVATTYFMFLELLNGDADIFVASMQFLWSCFHIARLLLIIEPCHMASVEAGKTIIIVCEVLRNCKDSTAEHILQRLWRQLLADKTYVFSACGMCKIDRQILTSLSGAIATYLVILIQFQKTDG